MSAFSDGAVPDPIRAIPRGIGQVFFQEHAITGAFFVLGIALNSPLMAAGAVAGSAIGWATALALKFDKSETAAGIYGFNAALVGIAAFFFFKPTAVSIGLLVAGCVLATLVTWAARRFVPFPTYTAPFIVTTWGLYFLGLALGLATVDSSASASGDRLRGGRGTWGRPGHVPGERLDGSLLRHRYRDLGLAARAVGCCWLAAGNAGWHLSP